jgi:hypothetical protein
MSTQSEKETKTNATTDPWAPQAAALQTAFTGAQGALTQASGVKAPTDYVAGMDPAAIAAFQQMIQQGGNLGIPGTQASTAGTLQQAGTGGVGGALNGLQGYDPTKLNNTGSLVDAANRYVSGQNIDGQVNDAMLNARQTARDVTMPGIEQNAAIGGNTNSSRTGIADGLVQRGLAEQATNLGATLRNNAFGTGLALASNNAQANNNSQVGALTAQGAIGNTAANTGVGAGTQSVANQGALTSEAAAGGAGMTAATQAQLDNIIQQYQSGVSSPFDALKQYMGVVGTNNWGSATQGDTTETKTPSAWDTISGLMSSGLAVSWARHRQVQRPHGQVNG